MVYLGKCFYCGFSGIMDSHICRKEVEYWKNKSNNYFLIIEKQKSEIQVLKNIEKKIKEIRNNE